MRENIQSYYDTGKVLYQLQEKDGIEFPVLDRKAWLKLQDKYPQMCDIIEPGIQKLQEYRNLTNLTPAYILSMCEWAI